MRSAPFLLITLALAWSAHAQDPADEPAWSVGATYTGELWSLDQNDAPTSSHYLDNLDLIANLDGERLFGLPGVKLFVYGLYNNGHSVSDGTDSVHGISNIEAVRAWRLYEAWMEWQFIESASVRAGLYDLNSEFDAIEAASLFVNPSHGIGPDIAQTGLNGPSIFPLTSVGVRVQAAIDGWQVRLAVLDAVPGDLNHPERTSVRWNSDEGLLYITEVDYVMTNEARTGIGYWAYSESFTDVVRVDAAGEPVTRDNNEGVYAFAETAPIAMADDRTVLRAFTRTGWANENVNPVARYLGAGISATGFIKNRDDQIGVSIARAKLGAPWREAMQNAGVATSAAETILELTARFALGSLVTLQPDVQYIRHCGGLDDRKAAWAFGLRFEFGATFEP